MKQKQKNACNFFKSKDYATIQAPFVVPRFTSNNCCFLFPENKSNYFWLNTWSWTTGALHQLFWSRLFRQRRTNLVFSMPGKQFRAGIFALVSIKKISCKWIKFRISGAFTWVTATLLPPALDLQFVISELLALSHFGPIEMNRTNGNAKLPDKLIDNIMWTLWECNFCV